MSLPLTFFAGGWAYWVVHRSDGWTVPPGYELVGEFEASIALRQQRERSPRWVDQFLGRAGHQGSLGVSSDIFSTGFGELRCFKRHIELPPPPPAAEEAPLHEPVAAQAWIGLALTDEFDEPMPDVGFDLEMVDGSTKRGTLDAEGRAREGSLPVDARKVRFPALEPDYVITPGRARVRDDSVSIDIVDEEGQPLDGEPYELRLPDGRSIAGTVDGGKIRIDHMGWAGEFELILPNVTRGMLCAETMEG